MLGYEPTKLSKQQRNRRNKQIRLANVTEVRLEKNVINNHQSILGKFMVYDWEDGDCDVNYPKVNSMSIQHFTTIDSSKTRSCWVTDESDMSIPIFSKISRNRARNHLAHPDNIRKVRSTSEDIIKSKPEVKRGTKCDSINSGYGIMGFGPDRNTPNNGTYAFNKTVTEEEKNKLEKQTRKIVVHLQNSLGGLKFLMHDDLSVMEQIVQGTSLNAIRSTAIAFSIGRDYHSKCHINIDMFYTLATVVGPDNVNDDEIIYYFLFPTYGKNGTKVPL